MIKELKVAPPWLLELAQLKTSQAGLVAGPAKEACRSEQRHIFMCTAMIPRYFKISNVLYCYISDTSLLYVKSMSLPYLGIIGIS